MIAFVRTSGDSKWLSSPILSFTFSPGDVSASEEFSPPSSIGVASTAAAGLQIDCFCFAIVGPSEEMDASSTSVGVEISTSGQLIFVSTSCCNTESSQLPPDEINKEIYKLCSSRDRERG